jgi:hypothetical protein
MRKRGVVSVWAGTCRHWWTDPGSCGSAALCTLRNVLRARALRRRSGRPSPADWRAVGIEGTSHIFKPHRGHPKHLLASDIQHPTTSLSLHRTNLHRCPSLPSFVSHCWLLWTLDGARPRLATHNDITGRMFFWPLISRNRTAPAEHASRFYFDIQYFAMSIFSLSTSINILLGSDDAHHT